MQKTTNKYFAKMIISWFLVAVWAYVIYYLSSKTAPESTVQSQTLISTFAGIFGKVIKDADVMTNIDGIVRETAHGVEYLILGFLVYRALYICLNYRKQEELLLTAETGIECTDKFRTFNCFVCAVLVCTIYALSDEVHQIAVPGRTFQLLDLAIDFCGIVIGVFLSKIIKK